MRTVPYDSLLMAYHAAEEFKRWIDTQKLGKVLVPVGDGKFKDVRLVESYSSACRFLETAKLSLDAADR